MVNMVNALSKVRWDEVDEAAPGLFKPKARAGLKLPGGAGGAGDRDDLAWFRDAGLEMTDYELAEVAVGLAGKARLSLQATYRRLDDPSQRVTPACERFDGDGAMSRLELAPGERVTSLELFVPNGKPSSSGSNDDGQQWHMLNYPQQQLQQLMLQQQQRALRVDVHTSKGRGISAAITDGDIDAGVGGNGGCCSRWLRFVFRLEAGFGVAGFWGGSDLAGLGIYFRLCIPRRWSPDLHALFPDPFRASVRMLLLSHKRLQRQQTSTADAATADGENNECGFGDLPVEVLSAVVAALNEVETRRLTPGGNPSASTPSPASSLPSQPCPCKLRMLMHNAPLRAPATATADDTLSTPTAFRPEGDDGDESDRKDFDYKSTCGLIAALKSLWRRGRRRGGGGVGVEAVEGSDGKRSGCDSSSSTVTFSKGTATAKRSKKSDKTSRLTSVNANKRRDHKRSLMPHKRPQVVIPVPLW